MNLFSFSDNFTSENSCRDHFKLERDKFGITCTSCKNTSHYWIKSVWSYECKKCNHRTSLRSGTIMQSSNLSFLVWYKTMFLLSFTKKVFSIKEIQKQLGIKRYEPVWALVHKLRRTMGKRKASYTLEGMIEMDEAYFTIEASELERSKGINEKGRKGKLP